MSDLLAAEVVDLTDTGALVKVPELDGGRTAYRALGTYPGIEIGDVARVLQDDDGTIVLVAGTWTGVTSPQGTPAASSPAAAGSFAVSPFVYVQAVPASIWTIVHTLGREPAAVGLRDTAGNEFDAAIRVVIPATTVEVSMRPELATAGKAVLL